MNNLIFGC